MCGADFCTNVIFPDFLTLFSVQFSFLRLHVFSVLNCCAATSGRSLEFEQQDQRKLVNDLQQKEQQQLHIYYQQQMNMQTTQAQQEVIQVSGRGHQSHGRMLGWA